jgi:hypothetical protein
MVGYFYWGYLGDKKFDANGNEVSTPDGNAFYSWSIIKALQDKGETVYLFSDRDAVGVNKLGKDLFKSFATDARYNAWLNCVKDTPSNLKYAIVEWRWEIPGRNDEATKVNNPAGYQPDLEMMRNIINECNNNNIPVIVFDLDYKLTLKDIRNYNIKYVIELGNKWEAYDEVRSTKIQIPFDFSNINEFSVKMDDFTADVIYIGNRYERDWCIDKYLPEGTVVHGNWLEPGHGDPENEWPHLKFRKRLSASEIQKPYNEAITTVLLAKKEYCEMGFMTARIQEAVFYGTVPLFIEEYGDETINTYAGKYANMLTVRSTEDVIKRVKLFEHDTILRREVITYLRKHLRFMDCKFFVNDIETLIYGN